MLYTYIGLDGKEKTLKLECFLMRNSIRLKVRGEKVRAEPELNEGERKLTLFTARKMSR
jgi:hypothetical protein